MYERFFGLRDKPFKLVPDPDYLYLSPSHARAMSHMAYALDQGDGFVLITGEVGTGKTTLCRSFLAGLGEEVCSAYIFNTQMAGSQLLSAICFEFGISIHKDCFQGEAFSQELLNHLNHYLMTQHQAGRKVMLVIDEAQNLSVDDLEMVRLLSNLETTRHKLLHIVLVGQPELAEKLSTRALRQLSQRISLHSTLMLLDRRQSRAFIEHRLGVAANAAPVQLFSPGAYRLLHRYSQGVPRRINIIADRALLLAYEHKLTRVPGAIVKKAISQLKTDARQDQIPNRRNIGRTAAVMVSGMMLLSALLMFVIQQRRERGVGWPWLTNTSQILTYKIEPPPPPLTVNVKTLQAQWPVLALPELSLIEKQSDDSSTFGKVNAENKITEGLSLEKRIQHMAARASRLDTLARVLALWHQPAPHTGQLPDVLADEQFFQLAALQYGLRMLTINDDWPLIRRLNLPAILPIKPATGGRMVFVTLENWWKDQMRLSLDNQSSELADSGLIQDMVDGRVYIFWQNILVDESVLSQNSQGKDVLRVKELLRNIGYDHLPESPMFDPPTMHAVIDFQMSQGITPDGLIGPVTKIMLNAAAKVVDTPHLDSGRPAGFLKEASREHHSESIGKNRGRS